MARKSGILLYTSALYAVSLCHEMAGRSRHGLIGYGIEMYYPTCASACQTVLASSQLSCSEEAHEDDMHGMEMEMDEPAFETSDECYATDDAFLQSLAFCISQRCPKDPSVGSLTDTRIEEWWQQNAVGTAAEQASPKENYAEALAKVVNPPTDVLVSGEALNHTMLVSDADYESNWNGMVGFENAELVHERYALVVVLSGVVIPIGFSLLRFVPFPKIWVSKFNAWVIDPPAVGQHHKVPILWGLVNMPTRGQALFVSYLIMINVVLSAVGYSSKQPSSYFSDTKTEILTYITNRTGVLSFANVPLLILYAGRNNILLWVTDWSHETFLVVHRYIAGVATLQAIIHSVIYLNLDLMNGTYSMEGKEPYWIWGAVATVGMSVLLPTSIRPLRRLLYEIFLLWHIAVSVLVIVGCYLHILQRFQHQWGYEIWIYIAIAVWGFDRVLRAARVLRNGLKWAVVTVIDEDYVRVDIEGVTGSGHAYLCFPSLERHIWQSHPFSVTSAMINEASEVAEIVGGDLEKNGLATVNITSMGRSSGDDSDSDRQTRSPKKAMTFFLRTRGGLTSVLRSFGSYTRLPVLVESSYGQHVDLSGHSTLICVVGGVGITAVLPVLRSHPGRRVLLWGVRKQGLIGAISDNLAGVEMKTFVGPRMVVRDELEAQLNDPIVGSNPVVVVSGPDGMADDARNAVGEVARRRKDLSVRLVEESFSW